MSGCHEDDNLSTRAHVRWVKLQAYHVEPKGEKAATANEELRSLLVSDERVEGHDHTFPRYQTLWIARHRRTYQHHVRQTLSTVDEQFRLSAVRG